VLIVQSEITAGAGGRRAGSNVRMPVVVREKAQMLPLLLVVLVRRKGCW
jgi:hypothetical protein